MRGRRVARRVMTVAVLGAVAVGCAVGPAAHRAERQAGPSSSPGPDGEAPGGPTDDPYPPFPEHPGERPTDEPGDTGEPEPTAAPREGAAELGDPVTGEAASACCLAPLPGGAGVLLGERGSDTVYRLDASGELTPLGTVPGRLLGLAVPPDAAAGSRSVTVYAYYTDDRAGSPSNEIAAFRYYPNRAEGLQWGATPVALLSGLPQAGSGTGPGNGGVLAFGPDGMLYAGTGDGGNGGAGADAGSLAGKILRMEPDGDLPEGQESYVYSSGYTDPRGLAWDGDRMWAVDGGEGTRLYSVVPGGEPEVRWESGEETAAGLAEDQGVLWVPVSGDGGASLLRFPLEGVELVSEEPQRLLDGGELSAPQGAAAVGAGELWVPTDDGVLRVEVE